MVFGFGRHLLQFVALVGQLCLDLVYLLRYRGHWPLLEISANFYKVGVQAMPVIALVGFLIGVVLSYLSALQLQLFGADVFIVNILGFGIIRELGPVLVAVLVAGRSGSAMTAQIGVMRVTEEIDALTTMGISRYVRLVLPKVVALTLAMPLVTLWGSSMALFGGMVSANLQLGLSFDFFINALPRAVPAVNLLIGLSKGAVFGLLDRAGGQPFRPPRAAQHREPVGQHDGLGGEFDHRGDPGGCGVRDRDPVQHRVAPLRAP